MIEWFLSPIPGHRRLIGLGSTAVVVAAMCFFPPWREWRIIPNKPYAKVTAIACYAPYWAPPGSEGPGHGYNVNGSILLIQVLIVCLVGASVAFGMKGALAFALPVGGFFGGGYLAVAWFFPSRAEAGWVFPIHLFIAAFFALVGALIGAMAASRINRAIDASRLRRRAR